MRFWLESSGGVVVPNTTSKSDTTKLLNNALSALADPSADARQWADVLCSSAQWQQVPGQSKTFNIDFSRMRTTTGFLTSDVQTPWETDHPQGIRVAFDEGAEMNTITRAAFERLSTDWATGHPGFAARDDIGRPHAIRLRGGVHLRGFHGNESRFDHMVCVHLRLVCACYHVFCTLVNHAPAEVLLGLPFRRRYDMPFPAGYPAQQATGVTSMCLGVPPGYGLCFPKALRRRFVGQDPTRTGFCQILRLDTTWEKWQVPGKKLTPEQLSADLGATSI